MSIIVTNEIHVDPARAEVVAAKFAKNSENMDKFEGYQGFELCRPTDPADDKWLVITHWANEENYQTWLHSKKFSDSHRPKAAESDPSQSGRPRSVVRHYEVAFKAEDPSKGN